MANPHAAAEIRDTIDDVATGVQRELRAGSRRYAVALRDVNRCFNASPLTEASIHAPARGQEFERTVIALAKIGRLPVDLVERALLDKGEDMILILAKAGGCSWTTVKELLLMRVAERKLQPDDLVRAFDRYKKTDSDDGPKHLEILRAARGTAGAEQNGGYSRARASPDNCIALENCAALCRGISVNRRF